MIDSQEVAKHLESQIQAADRKIQALGQDFELIPKRALTELVAKKAELDRWMSRRRTLIEVWEFMTNQVWAVKVRMGR